MQELEHHYAVINGIRMHYVQAGRGRRLVLLLHGFPEFWYGWRQQLPALSPYFTVAAPDLRGYNETDKPDWGYELDVLSADVVELILTLGYERAIVVGHDWGGFIAWMVAITHPHRVERLVTLNIPHPSKAVEHLRTNPRQMLRSMYAAFFQVPWLPELLISANDYAALEPIFRGTAIRRDTFSDDDIQAYTAALRKPGSLTAALNYYRALGRSNLNHLIGSHMVVQVPTLMIWGEKDIALGIELTYGTHTYVPDLRMQYIPNCSHWVQHEQPELVNQSICEFLSQLMN